MCSTWVGLPVDAEHARDRVAVDVGVDDADPQALGGHRGGEVDGHRRLADAALAGGDRRRRGSATRAWRTGPRARRGRRAACVAERLALLVGHDAELDAHGGRRRARAPTAAVTSLRDLVAHRAAGDGQQARGRRRVPSAAISTRVDHAELGDRAVDLGVVDRREGGRHLLDRGRRAWRRCYVDPADRPAPVGSGAGVAGGVGGAGGGAGRGCPSGWPPLRGSGTRWSWAPSLSMTRRSSPSGRTACTHPRATASRLSPEATAPSGAGVVVVEVPDHRCAEQHPRVGLGAGVGVEGDRPEAVRRPAGGARKDARPPR